MPHGSTVRPARRMLHGERECPRCGAFWTDGAYRYIAESPCRDCRSVLELEGIPIASWYRQKTGAA